jgi:adenosylcobyric acid synthase
MYEQPNIDQETCPVPVVRHGGLREVISPGESELIDASASINPLGPPAWLRQEVSRWLSAVCHYPDPDCRELVAAIAAANACSVDQVVVGNGSSELLAWLPHTAKQDRWVVPVPSYGEYRRAPALAGKRLIEVSLAPAPDFGVPWDRLTAALSEPSVVVLGHPNNPTGKLLDREEFHAVRARHPDCLFLVDEAFGDFVDDFLSVWDPAAGNLIVLRSLTKVFAIPGLRLGFAMATPALVEAWQRQIPPWSVNLLAQRVGSRALSDESYVRSSRQVTARWKASLAHQLRSLPMLEVHESSANWLLIRLLLGVPDASQVVERCLKLGVALRSCVDFPELGGDWLRISVRDDASNARIVEVLARVLGHAPCPPASERINVNGGARPKPRHAIMLQGCSSDAGKSILVTALCRCLAQDGYRVAPFKAQNMSNNSGVARDGGELGRAQVLQAEACGIEPDTRMNPVLLKPTSDRGAQVVVRGRAIGHRDALDYEAAKQHCLSEALRAFDELSAEYDVIVCEGAGSAGEMNLRHSDMVNMGFVSRRTMPVLLVGDIDRGGVYASFVGHMEVMSEADRSHVRGFIVNRFRGESRLLDAAHRWVEHQTGRPVLGVVPFLSELGLPDEDRLSLTSGPRSWGDPAAPLQIAAVSGPHVSNFTDLDALTSEPDLCVHLVERPEELGQPDVIVLLGTKNTHGDLAHFRRTGLVDTVLHAHAKGSEILGICGGLQMLGEWIEDEDGVESGNTRIRGLGLLPMTTRFAQEKTVRKVKGRDLPSGLAVEGYEIHHGTSELGALEPRLLDDSGAVLGAGLPKRRVWGTYLHGLFDADEFRWRFLDDLRQRRGLGPLGVPRRSSNLGPSLDALAKVFRDSVDLAAIYRLLGLES